MSMTRTIRRNMIRREMNKDGRRKIHKNDGRYKTFKGESESLFAQTWHKIRGRIPGKVQMMRTIRAKFNAQKRAMSERR